MCTSVIESKIARIMAGAKPRVLDLFAGCGGISLGFHAAGFDIIGAVEFDPFAARTHALNFAKHLTGKEFDEHAAARDITQLEPEELLKKLGYEESPESVVDIIVGGPPCQAFARVGRAKLREVAEHPEAYLQDPRGNLYLRYIHYILKLKPVAVLMENVPDVLNYGGHNIAEETCELLTGAGYKCNYTLLNSVYFGVPQMRERMFLLAVSDQIKGDIEFPAPSNWINLPKGYYGSRQVALKTIKTNYLFEQDSFYKPLLQPDINTVLPAVSAEAALSDLPVINDHLTGNLKRGTRKLDTTIRYDIKDNLNCYASMMRNWPGFESKEGVTGHVIRSLPRDYQIFACMNPGDQYPQAYLHALNIFNKELEKRRKTGEALLENSEEYKELKKKIVPPYDSSKFPNKWRKMEREMPSRTLMAHLGKDSYSHIHYDSLQARTISVREAARLQSFPDGFVFAGSMNPAFKQIGNAVPPLISKAIADKLIHILQSGFAHAKNIHTQTVDIL